MANTNVLTGDAVTVENTFENQQMDRNFVGGEGTIGLPAVDSLSYFHRRALGTAEEECGSGSE